MTSVMRARPHRREHGAVLTGVKAKPSGLAYDQP